jgi:hypothetical protein
MWNKGGDEVEYKSIFIPLYDSYHSTRSNNTSIDREIPVGFNNKTSTKDYLSHLGIYLSMFLSI